ncbi:NADPH-dependent FMN reductase [Xenorhabdus innexi]|uniref:FMN reductase n=1 Tax=Xenorhabdus innexi TaxID=290109 RepID=A0A1N6MTR3_9GAMM|nr:NADPH-dependent FMN reductase [Xenorhabdus innexi]PHM33420.1 FMN reductase [Xenorhabdus innexi]SIP72265.1 FMN reductase [Xenorhabdus innexi]
MRILFLGGSPAPISKSSVLLNYVYQWLTQEGIEAITVRVSDFDADALINANFHHPDIKHFITQLESVDGVVVAAPVYKASYPGGLKALFDLLPERALENKVVLPLMTAGSNSHLLALDYSLKPVLGVLKAEEIISGVYACDSQIEYGNKAGDKTTEPTISAEIRSRLDQNIRAFFRAVQRRPLQIKPLQTRSSEIKSSPLLSAVGEIK